MTFATSSASGTPNTPYIDGSPIVAVDESCGNLALGDEHNGDLYNHIFLPQGSDTIYVNFVG
jgi:hypothetical protein